MHETSPTLVTAKLMHHLTLSHKETFFSVVLRKVTKRKLPNFNLRRMSVWDKLSLSLVGSVNNTLMKFSIAFLYSVLSKAEKELNNSPCTIRFRDLVSLLYWFSAVQVYLPASAMDGLRITRLPADQPYLKPSKLMSKIELPLPFVQVMFGLG